MPDLTLAAERVVFRLQRQTEADMMNPISLRRIHGKGRFLRYPRVSEEERGVVPRGMSQRRRLALELTLFGRLELDLRVRAEKLPQGRTKFRHARMLLKVRRREPCSST